MFLHPKGVEGHGSVAAKNGDRVNILEDKGDSWRVQWQGVDGKTGRALSGNDWVVKKRHVQQSGSFLQAADNGFLQVTVDAEGDLQKTGERIQQEWGLLEDTAEAERIQ